MTTALPRHVVEDRRGRAVLMRGGTVGDGRGGSGWSRVAVDGRAGGLPWLLGCAAPVGLGPATPGAWDRRGAAGPCWRARVPLDRGGAGGSRGDGAGLAARGG